ncbi:sigma-70 family RNA polymerase sigma factor [Myxosarcina sp. GI1(2024)]
MIEVFASQQASSKDLKSLHKLDSKTELELILRCQRGDRASFYLLYQCYQQRVRSTLYQLCGGSLLDDLVQEVFIKAWKGLPKLRKNEHFATWLYRICWNVAIDRRRKLAKNRERGNLVELASYEEESNSPNSSSNLQTSPDIMQLHYQDLVQRGLENLSFDHRAVLVLHDLEDLPQKQVAKILDIPIGTVKSRLFHARNSMKNFLIQQGISL